MVGTPAADLAAVAAAFMCCCLQRPDGQQLSEKLSMMRSGLGQRSSSLCSSSGSGNSTMMSPEECEDLALDAAASIGSNDSLDSMLCCCDSTTADGSRVAAAPAAAPAAITTQQ
jgi:hypothetical protein